MLAPTPGEWRHELTLKNPPAKPTPDGGGGTTPAGWTTLASRIRGKVEPASPRALERFGDNTVTSTASHVVTLRYLAGVTTKTQGTFHDGADDRILEVAGVHDPEERHEFLLLACTEVIP